MAENETLPLLPNAETPLAWLPPDVALQVQATQFLFVAVIGAWIWDFFMSLGEEYVLLFKYRFTLPQLVYIIARVSSVLFVILGIIFQTSDIPNCNTLLSTIGWVSAVAMPSNSFLMFLRLRAVYNGSTIAVSIFGFLWVAVIAGSLAAPFSLKGAHIGTTQKCITTESKPYSATGLVILTVYDTLIFIAITYRLLADIHHPSDQSWSTRTKAFLSGNGMNEVSRLLLKTGQLYYLATAGMNIVTTVTIMAPSLPPVYHVMFTVPNQALENLMAARVFRKLKLGLLLEHSQSLTLPTGPLRFRTATAGNTFSNAHDIHLGNLMAGEGDELHKTSSAGFGSVSQRETELPASRDDSEP